MTTPSTHPHVIPAVANGLLRPDEVPAPMPLPGDPETRAARYARLAQFLEDFQNQAPAEGPEWTVEELFPPGRAR